MQRRHFLESSLLAAAGLATAAPAQAQSPTKKTTSKTRAGYYEMRVYKMRLGPQSKMVNDYLSAAFIPALNRWGVKNVGAFELMFGTEIPTTYVLIPYDSLATYERVQEKLATDPEFLKSPAAQSYLATPFAAPAYLRLESSLLRAFDSVPTVEVPPRQPRIFELRTYESPSEEAHAKKMEMFTPRLGELDIFHKTGLMPVFFGKNLIGPRLPSFTYMLTFPDLAAREKAWATFGNDPDWVKLRGTPGYTDIMSNISDIFLKPTAYSQI